MLKIMSLFTGAGGLDWGFHNGNYELVLSNEILENHLKTYTDNHKMPLIKLDDYDHQTNVGICGDIHNLKTDAECNLIMGGPPCQDFSLLRGEDKRAGVTVKRGKLYQQYLRIIKSSKPEIFIFENVPGMISANKGLAYKLIQEDFKNQGYELIVNEVIDLSTLGVAQKRKRLIIIGLKKEYCTDKTRINEITDKYLKNSLLEKYPVTTLELFTGKTLSDLQDEYYDIITKYENATCDIDNDLAKSWIGEYDNLSLDIIKDYLDCNNIAECDEDELEKALKQHSKILEIMGYASNNINDGTYPDNSNKLARKNKNVAERLKHIPPSYNFKAVENTKWSVRGLMSNIYRRIHPLKPSPTIIAYGGGGTGGYHYEYNRQGLTNRERARIQTFPDNYLFNGKSTEVRAQIGEAVPPLASYWIEKAVCEISEEFI